MRMNDVVNPPVEQGPPRWGFSKSSGSVTQADGLGWHRDAALRRNRISCSDHRTSCSGRGISCVFVPKGQPYVSLGQRPRKADPRKYKAPTGRAYVSAGTRSGNALKSKSNPIGVAAYELQSKLPGDLKGKLPNAKQLAGIVRLEMEAHS